MTNIILNEASPYNFSSFLWCKERKAHRDNNKPAYVDEVSHQYWKNGNFIKTKKLLFERMKSYDD